MSRKGENVRKRRDKRWEARFISGRSKSGKAIYRSVYGNSYAEVKIKRELAIAELLNGSRDKEVSVGAPGARGGLEYLDGDIRIVEDSNGIDYSVIAGDDFRSMCERWLSMKKGDGIRESTYNKYHNICHKYLIPGLGDVRCCDITQEMLEGYVDDLVCLADSTVGTVITVVNSIMAMAADEGAAGRVRLRSRRAERTDIAMPTKEEIERLIRLMVGGDGERPDVSRVGILLCLFTGIRIGELCALRWSDIDLENKVMRVEKTLQRLQNLSGNENVMSVPSSGKGRKSAGLTYLAVSSAKTSSSRRTVPLQPSLVELLTEARDAPQPGVFFLSGTACPVEPRTMEYRFKRYLKEAGLRDYRFHILRHAFATRCVELGLEVKTLSEILGHSSSGITMNKYVHPTLEMKRAFIDKVTFTEF